MTTLTQAAALTRRTIIVSVILITVSVIGYIGYNMWHTYYLANLPPAEEKPEMKFGRLPKITFPTSSVSSSNFSYTLDTATGGLPKTPKLLKVYFIPQAAASLLSPAKTAQLAENLGFPKGPERLSSSTSKFTDDNKNQLIIDIHTGNFNFQRQSTTAANITEFPWSTDKNQLLQYFNNYLSSQNLLMKELKNNFGKVVFNNSSLQTADKAEIYLFPENIDNIPIITADFNRGLIAATVAKTNEKRTLITKLVYTFWPIDQITFSTYPLKTAEEALTQLKSGQAFIAIEPAKPQVSISSTYLAYFESPEYSPYLQPVFVFEGPGFAALVPAISSGN